MYTVTTGAVGCLLLSKFDRDTVVALVVSFDLNSFDAVLLHQGLRSMTRRASVWDVCDVHLRGWIFWRTDVVFAVTVGADRFIGRLVGGILIKESDRGAVEIGHIGIQDIRGETVGAHQGAVGMALGA